MRFRHSEPLRWSDLDAQGHVNNVLLLDYLQDARVDFLRAGPAGTLLDTGVVVVSHAVEYLAPISYSARPVEVELGISQLGGAKFEITYDVSHDRLSARARTLLCPFDFEAKRPRCMTAVERTYFEQHLVDTEPLRELVVPPLAGRGYETKLAVRWSDLDSYGHVNNVKFFDYVMQARIDMTTAVAPQMARMGAGDAGYSWLVARQDVTYINQLDHRTEPYAVLTAPVKLGNSSVTLAAEITDGDRVYARAATVLVCAGRDGRAVELPGEVRRALSAHLIEAE